MFSLDRHDLQRIAVSLAGALLLAATSVAGVSAAINQAAAPAAGTPAAIR